MEWTVEIDGNSKNLMWIFDLLKIKNVNLQDIEVEDYSYNSIRRFVGKYSLNDKKLTLSCYFSFNKNVDNKFIDLINYFSEELKRIKVLIEDEEEEIPILKDIKIRCITFTINNFDLYSLLNSKSFSLRMSENEFIRMNKDENIFIIRTIVKDKNNNFIRVAWGGNSFSLFYLEDINDDTIKNNCMYDENIDYEILFRYKITYKNQEEMKYIKSKLRYFHFYIENDCIHFSKTDFDDNLDIRFVFSNKSKNYVNIKGILLKFNGINDIKIPIKEKIKKAPNYDKLFNFNNSFMLFKKLMKLSIENKKRFVEYIREYISFYDSCVKIKDKYMDEIKIMQLVI